MQHIPTLNTPVHAIRMWHSRILHMNTVRLLHVHVLWKLWILTGSINIITTVVLASYCSLWLFFYTHTGLDRPWGLQVVEAPRFQDSRHRKVVRLSAVLSGSLYPAGNIPGTHFCWRLSHPRGHSAAGRIMSMKNSSDTIGNSSRELPACSAVPQPTAPPGAPLFCT